MLARGDIFVGTVRDMASDGRGVVRHPSGVTVFVAGVWVGEVCEFRVTGTRGRSGVAEVAALMEPSAERVTPPCPYQGATASTCGGCPWQFVSYAAQLRAKQRRVVAEIGRLGASEDRVRQVWAADEIMAYRNRAQLKSDGTDIGFVANQTNQLVSVESCLVLDDHNNRTLRAIRARLPNAAWKPRPRSDWITLDIDNRHAVGEVSVSARLPFLQANDAQNLKMREWLAGKLVGIPLSQTVIELFCGSGNFTEVIAGLGFARVVAVDSVADAVASLRQKGLVGVEPRVANLFVADVFRGVFEQNRDARVLVLDPPREGLKMTSGLFAKKSRLAHVFYISCDLATLVRDLRLFMDNGYRLVEVQPVDMLPHTPHIELLVHLERS